MKSVVLSLAILVASLSIASAATQGGTQSQTDQGQPVAAVVEQVTAEEIIVPGEEGQSQKSTKGTN